MRKLCKFNNNICLLFGIVIYFHNSIFWLLKFWLAEVNNIYGFFIFVGAIYLIYERHRQGDLVFRSNFSIKWITVIVTLMIFDFLNLYFLDISILSALLFQVSFIVFIFSTIKNLRQNFVFLAPFSLLVLSSAPLLFYLNSTLGYGLRLSYVSLIEKAFSVMKISFEASGTIFFTRVGNINIDSGCSGLRSMYLLSVFIVFLSGISKKINIKKFLFVFFLGNTFYFIFNFFHLWFLIGLGEGYGFQIIEAHKLLANIVAFLGFFVTYIIWNIYDYLEK